MSNKDYNVYNNFDIHFVNYGELYKNPQEMEMESKELIGDYADALIKGSSDVYKNSPELTGNRYFIDTQTQCLDKNDNSQVHNRSILVDNINASAMSKTKDGNKGLIYSLLASMKSIHSNTMFESSNGEPIPHPKYSSTGYLKNIDKKPMPYCTNVSVYSDDKKERDISGWVTDEDRAKIDPLAIREGMTTNSRIEGMSAMMPTMTISGNQTGEEFMEGAKKQQIVMDEHVKATSETISDEANKASESAQNAISNSQNKANSHGKSVANKLQDSIKTNISEQKKRSDDAKAKGLEIQLKKETLQYLATLPPDGAIGLSVYDLFKTLLNTTFQCGTDENNFRRVPYQCIDELWKKHPLSDQNSRDAQRSDLCNDERKKISTLISPKNFFDALIELSKSNQNNTNVLNTLPNVPSKQICVMKDLVPEKSIFSAINTKTGKIPTMINGEDYTIMEKLLDNTFRFDVAKMIVRYNNIDVYGHCRTLQNSNSHDESTENFTNHFLECPKQNVRIQWLDFGAWIYMFILFLILFYILFRIIVKSSHLEKFAKRILFS